MALMTPSFLPSQSYPFGPGAGKTGLRFLFEQLSLQEGVVEAAGLKVSQRAAGGANLSVDVAPGGAWVKGDDTARQGHYHGYNDAVLNVAVPPNLSGSARFDQLVLRVYDSSIAGGTDGLAIEVLAGTPGATTIDNRVGAAALPNGAVRLAEWVTPNGAAAINDAIIRDRRPRARGFYHQALRTSGTVTPGGSLADIDANFLTRAECVGNPIVARLRGTMAALGGGGEQYIQLVINEDGTDKATAYNTGNKYEGGELIGGGWTPAVGSHVIKPRALSSGSTSPQLLADSTNRPLMWEVEEMVRPNASNTGA